MEHKTGIQAIAVKLRNESGETLVETLVSVLISAIALLMLATAIGTAVNIIMSSRDKMEGFYTDESSMLASTSSSTLTLNLGVALKDDSGNASTTKDVKVYRSTNEDSNIVLYREEVVTP